MEFFPQQREDIQICLTVIVKQSISFNYPYTVKRHICCKCKYFIMTDHYEQNRDLTGLPEQRLLGIEEIIVPFHVVKYCLRDGCGITSEPGMTLYTLTNIYHIDGTQIVSSKGNRVTKFLIGRKRLIKGLELGLKKVRKNEKIRLIISPQFGYGTQQGISLVPPMTKLIFEIDILHMARTPVERMSDPELYYEVYHHLDQSDSYLKKGKQSQGLGSLAMAFSYAKKIKHYRCTIVGKITLKWANILYSQGDYENSIVVLSRMDKNDETVQDALRLQLNLLKAMQRRQELQKLVQRIYQQHLYDNNIKRICINYYKQTQNWQKLKKLPTYDFKKDRFVEQKNSEKERNTQFRIFS